MAPQRPEVTARRPGLSGRLGDDLGLGERGSTPHVRRPASEVTLASGDPVAFEDGPAHAGTL